LGKVRRRGGEEERACVRGNEESMRESEMKGSETYLSLQDSVIRKNNASYRKLKSSPDKILLATNIKIK
jgi:hypothetical protein